MGGSLCSKGAFEAWGTQKLHPNHGKGIGHGLCKSSVCGEDELPSFFEEFVGHIGPASLILFQVFTYTYIPTFLSA